MKNKSILLAISLTLGFSHTQVSAFSRQDLKDVTKLTIGVIVATGCLCGTIGGLFIYEANRVPKDGDCTSSLNTFGMIIRDKEAKKGIKLRAYPKTPPNLKL